MSNVLKIIVTLIDHVCSS